MTSPQHTNTQPSGRLAETIAGFGFRSPRDVPGHSVGHCRLSYSTLQDLVNCYNGLLEDELDEESPEKKIKLADINYSHSKHCEKCYGHPTAGQLGANINYRFPHYTYRYKVYDRLCQPCLEAWMLACNPLEAFQFLSDESRAELQSLKSKEVAANLAAAQQNIHQVVLNENTARQKAAQAGDEYMTLFQAGLADGQHQLREPRLQLAQAASTVQTGVANQLDDGLWLQAIGAPVQSIKAEQHTVGDRAAACALEAAPAPLMQGMIPVAAAQQTALRSWLDVDSRSQGCGVPVQIKEELSAVELVPASGATEASTVRTPLMLGSASVSAAATPALPAVSTAQLAPPGPAPSPPGPAVSWAFQDVMAAAAARRMQSAWQAAAAATMPAIMAPGGVLIAARNPHVMMMHLQALMQQQDMQQQQQHQALLQQQQQARARAFAAQKRAAEGADTHPSDNAPQHCPAEKRQRYT